jgi:hypothetical protein
MTVQEEANHLVDSKLPVLLAVGLHQARKLEQPEGDAVEADVSDCSLREAGAAADETGRCSVHLSATRTQKAADCST